MSVQSVAARLIPGPIKRTKLYRFARWTAASRPYVAWRDLLRPRNLGLCWRVFGYTQQNMAGLLNVRDLAACVDAAEREGAFVECGVWRGGCAGLMGLLAGARGREMWLFDSFEGMPERSPRDTGEHAEELARGMLSVGTNVASVDDVRELLFRRLGLDTSAVRIRKGWFQDTIPSARDEIGPIALLRIDADWYESTRACLEGLYDNVVEGGFVVIDDYWWFPGCRAAVDEFLENAAGPVQLHSVDDTRVYFQKRDTASR